MTNLPPKPLKGSEWPSEEEVRGVVLALLRTREATLHDGYTRYSYPAQNEAVERTRYAKHARRELRGLANDAITAVLALFPPPPEPKGPSDE